MTEREKLEYAISLGVSTNALYSANGVLDHAELDRRILERERATREKEAFAISQGQRPDVGLHPWGVIVGLLFELGSDDVVELISATGLAVDWSLSAKADYSHTTRKRAYRPRVDDAYARLSEDDKLRVAWVVATQLVKREGALAGELARRLGPIGWEFTEDRLRPRGKPVQELFIPVGAVHDAYVEIRTILQSASASLTIVDPYLDETIFAMLKTIAARPLAVRLLTVKALPDVAHEAARFSTQHPDIELEVRRSQDFHDRFVIVDGARCFQLGHSIKDAGARACMINELQDEANVKALLAALEQAWETASPA